MTQRGKSEAQPSARTDRLRAALRENLKRRKAQAKGRAQESGPESPENAGEGSSGLPPARPGPGKGAGYGSQFCRDLKAQFWPLISLVIFP